MLTESVLDSVRLQTTAEGWDLEIRVITWVSPHEPSESWKRFRHWRHEPTDERLQRAIGSALIHHFRICTHCQQWTIRGHMHDEEICQICAEKTLDVQH